MNKYPLEKTYLAVVALRREGLFQPQNLVSWSPEEIGNHLKRAGYDRGEFMTSQFASRLRSLGLFMGSAGITECERILRKGDTNAVKELLKPVKGIGPQVLANFSLLRNP